MKVILVRILSILKLESLFKQIDDESGLDAIVRLEKKVKEKIGFRGR